MSQRRRQRRQDPVETQPIAPPSAAVPETTIERETSESEEDLARQTPAIAYGLTIAMVLMLLVCALAVYIAAP